MKAKTQKPARTTDANRRELIIAAINAALRSLDGKVPRRLRLDPTTLEIYQMVPVTNSGNEGILGAMEVIGPVIRELKRAKV